MSSELANRGSFGTIEVRMSDRLNGLDHVKATGSCDRDTRASFCGNQQDLLPFYHIHLVLLFERPHDATLPPIYDNMASRNIPGL